MVDDNEPFLGKKMEKKTGTKVCVTGGAGFLASWLVKKLLEEGHTVHATLRDLNDRSKVEFLRSFPNAETGLILFKAEIYDPESFDEAIQGCEFVFNVATPLIHAQGSQFKSTTEAAVAAARSIGFSCVRSGSVRRLIYTASVVAASPMKEDGTGYKDAMDEACWTSLDFSFPFIHQFHKDYVDSKTMTEREMLSFDRGSSNGGIEVVSLVIGLVGGDSLNAHLPLTTAVTLAQFLDSPVNYDSLRFMEEIDGKVPLVHVEDVCAALLFCMHQPSINGRFLCASSYISTAEIARYVQQKYPETELKHRDADVQERDIRLSSRKLGDKGFIYKYNSNMILDDCLKVCRARKMI